MNMIERYVIAYAPDEVISDLWHAHESAGYATAEEAEAQLATYPEKHRDDFRVYRVLIEPVKETE